MLLQFFYDRWMLKSLFNDIIDNIHFLYDRFIGIILCSAEFREICYSLLGGIFAALKYLRHADLLLKNSVCCIKQKSLADPLGISQALLKILIQSIVSFYFFCLFFSIKFAKIYIIAQIERNIYART